ncbi:transcriptional regulator [Melghiribacillus thermohalophilus]|uniref:Transcriptional regulator n=1 Tax=Melghiribacillus thermohalophilus TaxID=1324956 RepID=A0A4R3ND68_9BACI|nr:MerR family transcriptional regulator [Melghiribacillus thermohalophilus]TCT26933.1 transcriptional regulator [Melghiribacillus thermohalophilus]
MGTQDYKTKKVISIGTVSELTGLSVRQIRYYEERKLVFPERTENGTRKFSFQDIEILNDIANKREEGVQTYEIRQEMLKENKNRNDLHRKMLKGQINAHFNLRN